MKFTPFNPCPQAIKRVTHPLPKIRECRYCKSKVIITQQKRDYPWIYQCTNTKCDARVGMHPNTDIPLGILANYELRWKRRKAKALFKEYQKNNGLTRTDAYVLLANILGISISVCHFGFFDVRQCNKILISFRTGLQ